MRHLRTTSIALALPLGVLLVPPAGIVQAQSVQTPPPPVVEELAKGEIPTRFTLETKQPSDFVFRRITIEPGATTGWHYHPGELLAVVQSGTLTRYENDCRAHVHPAGTALVEPAGERHVRMGANLGDEPVVLYVTYVLPDDAPPAVPVEHANC
jgi:quercetin dioxygenase-like cupin family protein